MVHTKLSTFLFVYKAVITTENRHHGVLDYSIHNVLFCLFQIHPMILSGLFILCFYYTIFVYSSAGIDRCISYEVNVVTNALLATHGWPHSWYSSCMISHGLPMMRQIWWIINWKKTFSTRYGTLIASIVKGKIWMLNQN